MLVFAQARLVFLSVPKTGTTAWAAALAPLASLSVSAPPELKHAPVFRYNRFFRPMLEKFVADRLDVLAVMREPVAWLGSWYRYRQRGVLQGHPNSTHGLSFDTFVSAYLKGRRPAFAEVGAQSKFLEPQRNGTAVTHLFRYEDQAGLQAFLEERLQTTLAVARRNESPAQPLALSHAVARRLRRKQAADFALYDGIGSSGRYTRLPAAIPD